MVGTAKNGFHNPLAPASPGHRLASQKEMMREYPETPNASLRERHGADDADRVCMRRVPALVICRDGFVGAHIQHALPPCRNCARCLRVQKMLGDATKWKSANGYFPTRDPNMRSNLKNSPFFKINKWRGSTMVAEEQATFEFNFLFFTGEDVNATKSIQKVSSEICYGKSLSCASSQRHSALTMSNQTDF
ncbi:hypothetical protein ACRALDRAFT_2019601 [Sodiomyces alcalophilus JCM 7366]|uniref:uncharacterized protein n=1 Tax=Sodiomyces alcalophilus JCM 7366 TaxID=591952 RepID=UPI0039B48009